MGLGTIGHALEVEQPLAVITDEDERWALVVTKKRTDAEARPVLMDALLDGSGLTNINTITIGENEAALIQLKHPFTDDGDDYFGDRGRKNQIYEDDEHCTNVLDELKKNALVIRSNTIGLMDDDDERIYKISQSEDDKISLPEMTQRKFELKTSVLEEKESRKRGL